MDGIKKSEEHMKRQVEELKHLINTRHANVLSQLTVSVNDIRSLKRRVTEVEEEVFEMSEA